MRILRAPTREDLLRELASIDIEVAPRAEGRTWDQTELYSICRSISSLYETSRLTYPLKLLKSERPGFMLVCNGEGSIGVEVTEVVDEDFARAQVLPEVSEPDAVLDRSLFRWGDARRSLDELREIASRTSLTGPGWEHPEW